MNNVGQSTAPSCEQATTGLTRNRAVRVLLALLIVGVVLAATVGVLLWLHYHNLPRFEAWLKSARGDDAIAAWPSDAVVLSRDGNWSVGEISASAGTTEMPNDELDFDLQVRHGEDLLLDWKQSVALSYTGEAMDRRSVATRLVNISTHPDMHALARVFVHDADRLVGSGSVGVGRIEAEVWLLTGAGPSEVVVLDAREPSRDYAKLEIASASSAGVGHLLDPSPELPADGLVHHYVLTGFLSSKPLTGGTQGMGMGDGIHTVNTNEYSYSAQSSIETRGRGGKFSRTTTSERSLTFNGRVW